MMTKVLKVGERWVRLLNGWDLAEWMSKGTELGPQRIGDFLALTICDEAGAPIHHGGDGATLMRELSGPEAMDLFNAAARLNRVTTSPAEAEKN